MFLTSGSHRTQRREAINRDEDGIIHHLLAVMVIASCTVLLAGCTLINASSAMGDGNAAEEAVLRLDDQQALEDVSLRGKNIKARVLAIGKLDSVSRLEWFIKYEDQPAEISIAAFQRIVALGKAEEVLRNDSSISEIVVMGKESRKERLAFPEEWRIKAIQISNSCFGDDDVNAEFLFDQTVPLRVRQAASGKIRLDEKGFVRLLNAATDKSNPNHKAYRSIAEGFYASKDCYTSITDSIFRSDESDQIDASLAARQLLFSFPRNEEKKRGALQNILRGALDDEEAGKKDTENIQFFKWAFATAKNPKIVAEIIRSKTYDEKNLQCLLYMANCIDDDTVLADLLAKDHDLKSKNVFSPVVETLVSRIKDPKIKKDVGTLALAYNAVEPKNGPTLLLMFMLKARRMHIRWS